MTSHLRVDLAALGRVAGELGVLRGQFDSSADIADAHRSSVGSDHVIDALHHFATNWQRHREKLSSSLDAIGSMAREGHDTYQQVDDQLADSLQAEGGHGGHGR